MSKEVVSRESGGPDFVLLGRRPSRSIASEVALHFSEELAKNESEQENLSELSSNKIIIHRVSIGSVQALHYRLEFYSKDSFTDSDLDEDAFVGAVDLDLSTYGSITL